MGFRFFYDLKVILFVCLFQNTWIALAGNPVDSASVRFYVENRARLRKLLPDSSMVIVFSAPERNRWNDVEYPFHQNPNFYFLTGIREKASVLVMFKERRLIGGSLTNEMLFVQDKNAKEEVWTGKRAGLVNSGIFSGITKTYNISDFLNLQLPYGDRNVFLSGMEEFGADDFSNNETVAGIITAIASQLGQSEQEKERLEKNNDRFPKFMAVLRQYKSPYELDLMRKAILSTGLAHKELMKSMEPDMNEYQAQAIVEYVFKVEGCETEAFPSIIGSGENTCILHYTANDKRINNNDLIVVDIGAQYKGYAADVTRTLPANGKYNEQQRLIYELVLEAQQSGIEACKPGASFSKPHKAAKEVLAKGLVKLGITKSNDDVNQYFIHGTSHYLGLDVHDVGLYGDLAEGDVITVEPGLYIPEGSKCDPKWWNIGVRIEDDVLITLTGYEVLSDFAPRKVEEIEKMMKEVGIFKFDFVK